MGDEIGPGRGGCGREEGGPGRAAAAGREGGPGRGGCGGAPIDLREARSGSSSALWRSEPSRPMVSMHRLLCTMRKVDMLASTRAISTTVMAACMMLCPAHPCPFSVAPPAAPQRSPSEMDLREK